MSDSVEPEPEFSNDLETTNEAVARALNEIAEVRAYTLKADELKNLKAAQYALRDIHPDRGNYDPQEAFDDE